MADEKKAFVHIEEKEEGIEIRTNVPPPALVSLLIQVQNQVLTEVFNNIDILLAEKESDDKPVH